ASSMLHVLRGVLIIPKEAFTGAFVDPVSFGLHAQTRNARIIKVTVDLKALQQKATFWDPRQEIPPGRSYLKKEKAIGFNCAHYLQA
ncbi:hypothetical protein N8703_03715, partial [Verrucomicrobia bacterium]|nr:hypothetical protein [Verrucomicrobiota bacterium]